MAFATLDAFLAGEAITATKNVTEDGMVWDVMKHVVTVVMKANAPMSMELA
uniref:Uncharacterized protein n=1 Tax=Magallana gigas TaxID=29159 RepID=K1PWA0_MAGGI